jgi:hypothetical protein
MRIWEFYEEPASQTRILGIRVFKPPSVVSLGSMIFPLLPGRRLSRLSEARVELLRSRAR